MGETEMKHLALGAIVICLASLLAEDTALAQAGSTGGIVGKQNKDASGGVEAITPNRPKTRSTLRSAPSTDTASSCRGFVGNWLWFSGAITTINADGTFKGNSLTGSWTCKGNDVTMIWSHGYNDRLTVSADGRKLNGTNNIGFSISGPRVN